MEIEHDATKYFLHELIADGNKFAEYVGCC